MVQKSGYYARAAKANPSDLSLIKSCCDLAVECAMKRQSGCIGHDDNSDGKGEVVNIGKLRAIEFERIKGGKPFDIRQLWFTDMMSDILAHIPPLDQHLTRIASAPPPDGYVPQLPNGLKLPRRIAIL